MAGVMGLDQQSGALHSYPSSPHESSQGLASVLSSSPHMMPSTAQQQSSQSVSQDMPYSMSQTFSVTAPGGYTTSAHTMTLPLSQSYSQTMSQGITYSPGTGQESDVKETQMQQGKINTSNLGTHQHAVRD